MESGPDDTEWPLPSDNEALEVALEESRRAFDNEITAINDVDEKAMRSGRLGLLILGIVVSGVAIFGSEVLTELSIVVVFLGGIGLLMVFISTLFALGTYTATEYPTGMGPEHRESALQDGYSRTEWLELMVEEYGDWMEEVNEMASSNAQYLENTILIQMFGLLAISLAVVVGYLHRVYEIPPKESLLTIFSPILLAFLLSLATVPLRE